MLCGHFIRIRNLQVARIALLWIFLCQDTLTLDHLDAASINVNHLNQMTANSLVVGFLRTLSGRPAFNKSIDNERSNYSSMNEQFPQQLKSSTKLQYVSNNANVSNTTSSVGLTKMSHHQIPRIYGIEAQTVKAHTTSAGRANSERDADPDGRVECRSRLLVISVSSVVGGFVIVCACGFLLFLRHRQTTDLLKALQCRWQSRRCQRGTQRECHAGSWRSQASRGDVHGRASLVTRGRRAWWPITPSEASSDEEHLLQDDVNNCISNSQTRDVIEGNATQTDSGIIEDSNLPSDFPYALLPHDRLEIAEEQTRPNRLTRKTTTLIPRHKTKKHNRPPSSQHAVLLNEPDIVREYGRQTSVISHNQSSIERDFERQKSTLSDSLPSPKRQRLILLELPDMVDMSHSLNQGCYHRIPIGEVEACRETIDGRVYRISSNHGKQCSGVIHQCTRSRSDNSSYDSVVHRQGTASTDWDNQTNTTLLQDNHTHYSRAKGRPCHPEYAQRNEHVRGREQTEYQDKLCYLQLTNRNLRLCDNDFSGHRVSTRPSSFNEHQLPSPIGQRTRSKSFTLEEDIVEQSRCQSCMLCNNHMQLQ